MEEQLFTFPIDENNAIPSPLCFQVGLEALSKGLRGRRETRNMVMPKEEQAARREGSIQNECHCPSDTLAIGAGSMRSPFHPCAVLDAQH